MLLWWQGYQEFYIDFLLEGGVLEGALLYSPGFAICPFMCPFVDCISFPEDNFSLLWNFICKFHMHSPNATVWKPIDFHGLN